MKCPFSVEKAVFSLSSSSISTCQYPEAKSNVVNNVDPARDSKVASHAYQTILSLIKLQRACWNGERQQTRSPLNVRQYLDPLHFGCNVSNINSLLCIDGNVGKRSVNMLFDSGAAVSVIRSGVLEDRSRNLVMATSRSYRC